MTRKSTWIGGAVLLAIAAGLTYVGWRMLGPSAAASYGAVGILQSLMGRRKPGGMVYPSWYND